MAPAPQEDLKRLLADAAEGISVAGRPATWEAGRPKTLPVGDPIKVRLFRALSVVIGGLC